MSKYLVKVQYTVDDQTLVSTFAARAKGIQYVKEQYHRYVHENYHTSNEKGDHKINANYVDIELSKIEPVDEVDLLNLKPIAYV